MAPLTTKNSNTLTVVEKRNEQPLSHFDFSPLGFLFPRHMKPLCLSAVATASAVLHRSARHTRLLSCFSVAALWPFHIVFQSQVNASDVNSPLERPPPRTFSHVSFINAHFVSQQLCGNHFFRSLFDCIFFGVLLCDVMLMIFTCRFLALFCECFGCCEPCWGQPFLNPGSDQLAESSAPIYYSHQLLQPPGIVATQFQHAM